MAPAHVPSTGIPGANALAQRRVEPEPGHALRDGRTFTAGEHERFDAVDVFLGAYLARLGTCVRESARVRGHIALDREDPDARP